MFKTVVLLTFLFSFRIFRQIQSVKEHFVTLYMSFLSILINLLLIKVLFYRPQTFGL